MNPNLTDWDDDLPPEPEAAYKDLIRALKRKSGFGLFFVQCTPVEADRLITKLPQDIRQKHIEALRLVEPIDNLYQRVVKFVKDKQVDILLIKGLEYSLYKYEQRTFGEITESRFSDLVSVPHILNHLNQQRERFRDDFPLCFVFLLRSFSINYLIHRAPDFFDWRSGVFELPTTTELLEKESIRLILEGDYEEYLKLSQEQKIEKVLEIQDLLEEKNHTENTKVSLLLELGNLLYTIKESEAAIAAYEKALQIKPDERQAWNNRGNALFNLGRYEEAIINYDKVIELKYDNYLAWYKKGEALRKLGRYEEAIINYDKVIILNPNDYWTWYHRGLSFSELGRYEEAIASYDRTLNIDSNNVEVWGNRGMAFYYLNNYNKALDSYDKAISLKPNCCAGIYYYKAVCFVLQKNIKFAIENLQRAIAINPDKYQEKIKNNSVFNAIREDEQFPSLIK